jgi:aryl-alcohol dehydrogenase-like predicted oxidoreductase
MKERRDFLRQLAMLTGGMMLPISSFAHSNKDKWGSLLPLRTLGKTGQKVTMLGLGGWHAGDNTDRDAQELIEKAMEGGIRFFDTAESYQDGGSEIIYGKYLVPKYRDDVFIMTKSTADNAVTAKEHLEGSLQRMKCDYIDLWQVHSLRTPQDVDNRIKNDVLEVFEKAKAEGKVKHIGFTGHQNPFANKHFLDRTYDNDIFETVQMPINIIDSHFHSFIKNVLPLAIERNLGVLAMKTLSNGRFFKEMKKSDDQGGKSNDSLIPDYISIKEALYFVWSLPVSVLITGADKMEYLEEKIELAKNLAEYSDTERFELLNRVFEKASNKIEYYKKV